MSTEGKNGATEPPAVRVRGLEKQFGDVTVLDGLDLTVEHGEVFGFLGPNGAGKSTTIDVLLGLCTPTDGEAEVLGYDAVTERHEVHRHVGVLPEGVRPFEELTGTEHVEFVAQAGDADPDPHRLLAYTGLEESAHDRPASAYSTGMEQRLWLAMALVGEPELLVLDEPTTGLDPDGIAEMRELIADISGRGCTVFFSSHRLAEVAATCDRVGVLHDGRIQTTSPVSDGSLAELADEVVASFRVPDDPAGLAATLRDEDAVDAVSVDGEWVTATCSSTGARVTAVETALSTTTPTDLRVEPTSLETLFDRTVHGAGA